MCSIQAKKNKWQLEKWPTAGQEKNSNQFAMYVRFIVLCMFVLCTFQVQYTLCYINSRCYLKKIFLKKMFFSNEIGKRKGKIESYNGLLRRQLSNTANPAGGSHVRPQKIVIPSFLDVSVG